MKSNNVEKGRGIWRTMQNLQGLLVGTSYYWSFAHTQRIKVPLMSIESSCCVDTPRYLPCAKSLSVAREIKSCCELQHLSMSADCEIMTGQ
jgi:hypothetical protein